MLVKGYAAVDDILVHEGDCPPVDFCTFEKDLCEYVNDPDADFTWSRGNSTQGSTNTTGPSIDHTLGTSDGKKDINCLEKNVSSTK